MTQEQDEEREALPLTDAELDALEQGRIGCRCAQLAPEVRRMRAELRRDVRIINEHTAARAADAASMGALLRQAEAERDAWRRLASARGRRRMAQEDSDTHAELVAIREASVARADLRALGIDAGCRDAGVCRHCGIGRPKAPRTPLR